MAERISEILLEMDMLEGTVNRMCVTHDKKELEDMRDWAKRRIDKIFNYRQADFPEVQNG